MIISRTPLRVSFCGGGTDFAAYYEGAIDGGCVTSMALARHIHVTVNRRFDNTIRVSYSKLEHVDSIDQLDHELVREAMRLTGVTTGVEITTIADIPSRGTGLGSSSAVTVGLLNALHRFAGHDASAKQLAEEACRIEIGILNQPIGKQDQYATAFGGLNHIKFSQNGDVELEQLVPESGTETFCGRFSLLFTGQTRLARDLLSGQNSRTDMNRERLDSMAKQAKAARSAILTSDSTTLSTLLNQAWDAKRGLAEGISLPDIDSLFSILKNCGSSGAKLLGAGGGGFILFEGGESVKSALLTEIPEARVIPLELDSVGSCIIHEH